MVTYKELEIHKISHTLAVEVHKTSLKELPIFEMYEEGAQLRRSSKSVVASIVEGFGRRRYIIEYPVSGILYPVSESSIQYQVSSIQDHKLLRQQ